MDMARLTDKWQITIPVNIRLKLGLREGDKVVFTEQDGNVVLINSNRMAWEELQKAFSGEAERVGWTNEQNVIDYCKEIRQEMYEERHGHND